MLPGVLQQYISADKVAKGADKIKKELRDQVIALLKVSDYPGISYGESESTTVNQEVFLKWAHDKLEAKQYERLFVRVFDPNALALLIQEGVIDRNSLPENYAETKVTPRITVKQ